MPQTTPVYNLSVNVVLLAFIYDKEKSYTQYSKSLPFHFEFGFHFTIIFSLFNKYRDDMRGTLAQNDDIDGH